MVPGARLPTQFPTPRCNRSIAELSWQSPVAAGSEWSLKIETARPLSLRGTICPFSREMQTVFLKRGRDHPELLGRWEKGREQIRPTQRGRRAEPKFHGAMPPVAIVPATRGGYWNERPATRQTCHHPLNTQARCRGLRAWTHVTTHSLVRRRQRKTSACANQPLGHWRPLTAIIPKASQARLTSRR